MRRIVIVSLALMLVLLPIVSCSAAPARASRKTVRVAALTFPGGGAPPSMLALYKAALEVNRNLPDIDIQIVTVTPPAPEFEKRMSSSGMPAEGKPDNTPPTVSALEQALGQDPPPDVVLFGNLYEYFASLDKDLLQPLDNFFRGDRNVKPDDYYPGALEVLKDGDRLYGLPIAVAPTVLMYDKRVFDEAGAPEPDSDWDWSTFLGIARQVTRANGDPESDVYALNLFGPMLLPAFIWQNGGEIVSKDGKRSLLNEPEAVEAIKFYYDLIHTYKVVPPEPKPSDGMVMEKMGVARAMPVGPGQIPPLFGPNGRVAMQVMNNAGSQYSSYPFGMMGGEQPFKMIELPRGKVPATMMEMQVAIAMTNRVQDGSLAYKAMVALSEEMQKEMAVPARRSLAKNLRQISPSIAEDDATVILNALEHARVMPFMGKMTAGNNIQQVLYEKLFAPLQQGTKSPEEIAKETSDALDEALNQQ